MKDRLNKRMIGSAVLLACLFLAADEWLLFHRIFSQRLPVASTEDGSFVLPFSGLFSPYAVREGTVHIVSSERLSAIEIDVPVMPDSFMPRKQEIRRISPRRYVIPETEDILDWTLRFRTVRPGMKTVDIAVILKPAFRLSVWFIKAGFLFFAVLMFLAAAVRFFPAFHTGESRAERLTRLILAGFLGTMAASFMSIVLHPDSFFGFAVRHGIRLPQTGLFNAVLGLLLVLALAVYRKFRLPLFLWPLVLSAATIPIFPVFRLDVCGDAHEWMSLLTMHGRNLYGAELLSFPLAKAVMNLGRVFVPSLSQDAALVLTGKLMGILTLFALAWFISGEIRLSRERKALFLILATTLGFSALLIGYPEFAYFPLPFLLAAAGSARRFLGPGGGRNRDLMLTSFWTTTAGLFHGSAWIILPAVFIMPLLRARENGRPTGFGRIVMAWAAAGGIAAAVILGSFWTARVLGFEILMRNISGGGDGEMFVNFVDKSTIALSGVLAFESRYLWERAWAFFLAIPLPFLFWAILSIRRLKEQIADRFLLAAGILSLAIFFFWNFDLGYRDFDLYIIPLTLIVLLLIKWLLETAPTDFSPRLEALLVFFCALASPIALILQMTTVSLF